VECGRSILRSGSAIFIWQSSSRTLRLVAWHVLFHQSSAPGSSDVRACGKCAFHAASRSRAPRASTWSRPPDALCRKRSRADAAIQTLPFRAERFGLWARRRDAHRSCLPLKKVLAIATPSLVCARSTMNTSVSILAWTSNINSPYRTVNSSAGTERQPCQRHGHALSGTITRGDSFEAGS